MKHRAPVLALLAAAAAAQAQPAYELLLKGGHVIDPKNGISARMDVAVAKGRIARVAPSIDARQAARTVDVSGLYVTPGLIDMHVHVYAGTGLKGVYTGDLSVYPDGFSFRSGVTTMVDAGTAGWRNFPDFRQRVIERARTRVLAFLNIVGGGMGITSEDDPADMDAGAAVRMARQHRDLIVGIKVAHYSKEGWPDVDNALKAANELKLPIMVDFGWTNENRNLKILMEEKLRPGDIYTHCYSGHRDELLDGKTNPAMWNGRRRGILFDVGHGGGSFYWNIAVPMTREGFWPDSISTDLHTGSMNAGMKDMTNVMSKILNLGATLEDVIRMSTWAPARQIGRTDLGHLSEGAEADITVLSLQKGKFGFIDAAGARLAGDRMLVAELTIKGGQVMWDRLGWAATDWEKFPYRKRERPR
ncbi:MAG: amidohydrolase/deacetylase family metallohydrolase [Bryobacteraceae bacterium]|nr:amidohydrolase/deacetylase family metallohydrolase [Bryobacteraceae bacterium]